MLLTTSLSTATDSISTKYIINNFVEDFETTVPDWKDIVIKRLQEDYPNCYALKYLKA